MSNILGNKKAILASITLIALLAVSIFAVLSPTVNAHTPPLSIPNYVYVSAFPNPVGVGQTISLFAWSATYPPTAQGEYGDRWTNLEIIVTAPDGSNTTLGPFTSDPVGTIFTTYTPENWQLLIPVPHARIQNRRLQCTIPRNAA